MITLALYIMSLLAYLSHSISVKVFSYSPTSTILSTCFRFSLSDFYFST